MVTSNVTAGKGVDRSPNGTPSQIRPHEIAIAAKFGLEVECAPGSGQAQAAVLTVCRAC